MGRVKNGTKMAWVTILKKEKDSTFVSDYENGILNTVISNITTIDDEASDPILDELGAQITDEDDAGTSNEITTISFVGNENPTPDAEVGLFKVAP